MERKNSYDFAIKDAVLRHHEILRNWLKGWLDRKAMFYKFCNDNNIPQPPVRGENYAIVEAYQVRSHQLEHLGSIRDDEILRMHERYIKCQQAVEEDRLQATQELIELKRREQALINCIKTLEAKIAKTKLQEKLNHEADLSTAQDELTSLPEQLKKVQTTLEQLELANETNARNWRKQVDIIDNRIADYAGRYVARATKKIVKRLRFNRFAVFIPEHSAEVKKILVERSKNGTN